MKKTLKWITRLCLLLVACNVYASHYVSTQKPKPKKFTIRVDESKKQVDILLDGQVFTSYIYPDALKKPVLYPIRTASGTVITRGWPLVPREGERVDHPHHVGLWFNFGDVNGLDFWNNSTDIAAEHRSRYGTIRHIRIDKTIEGDEKAELHVTMDWLNPDSVSLIREKTKYIFAGDGNTRTIQRITNLTALEEIRFKDNKEGMFALRVSRELEQPATEALILTDKNGTTTKVPQLNNDGVSGRYYSSEGKEGDDVWGTRAKWVALKGKINNEAISLIILDHPSNLNYPGWWHARGYGLFGINPLAQKAMGNNQAESGYTLAKGKSLTFNHKLIIRSGEDADRALIESNFSEFAR